MEDNEKEYVLLPGPKLMGSGEGGVGGDDVGDSPPKFILIQHNLFQFTFILLSSVKLFPGLNIKQYCNSNLKVKGMHEF